MINKREDLLAAVSGLCGAAVDSWQPVTEFTHRLGEQVDVALGCARFDFVGFGKHQDKGHFRFDQPLDELKVDFLWAQARVDQYKDAAQIRPVEQII